MPRLTPPRKVLFVSLVILLIASQACTVSPGINGVTSNEYHGEGIYALAIDPATSTTLYAGTYGGGVFKSTNGGANWSAVNTGLPTYTSVHALAIDPATPTTLYAGTSGGVLKSTDGGGTWSAFNTGLTTTDVRALAISPAPQGTLSPPSTLYAGTDGGGVFAMQQIIW
jgi:hypothetical protein